MDISFNKCSIAMASNRNINRGIQLIIDVIDYKMLKGKCLVGMLSAHRMKATFHLTISMRGQRATRKIQKNNYHHGSCGPSLTGKTSSVSLIFAHGTHRNVKNRLVRSSLKNA